MLAKVIAKLRKIRPYMVVISLIVGLIAGLTAYLLYLPGAMQLIRDPSVVPEFFIEIYPVEYWWTVPIFIGFVFFLLIGTVTFGLIMLITHLRKPHGNSSPD